MLTLTLMTGISDLHEEEGSWDSVFTFTLWKKCFLLFSLFCGRTKQAFMLGIFSAQILENTSSYKGTSSKEPASSLLQTPPEPGRLNTKLVHLHLRCWYTASCDTGRKQENKHITLEELGCFFIKYASNNPFKSLVCDLSLPKGRSPSRMCQ